MYLGIVLGPMGAGKSTYLYDKYRAFSKRGNSVKIVCITHTLDTRCEEGIYTHNCVHMPASKVNKLCDLDIGDDVSVILIDEAQFFDDLYVFIDRYRGREGIHIYVAGLNGDYKQERFGNIIDIIPMASEVIYKHSICDICGDNAPFSMKRNVNSDQVVEPGGFDKYFTVCHKHLCANTK